MKKILLSFIVSFLFFAVFGQESNPHRGPWTMDECINYAIEHNNGVKQSQYSVEQSAIELNTAKNSVWPSLQANGSQSLNFGRGLTEDNIYTKNNTANTSFSIGGSLDLFTGLRVKNNITMGKLNLQAATADYEKAKDDIRIAIRQAYTQILFSMEISKVAAYMSPGNRFFAPYYRHTTLDAWATQNEDTLLRRERLAMDDVRAAFDHFQAQRDQSRPLIIAGFSQGGMAVVDLLKYINDETNRQLAAAYVLGYKVTEADMAQCSHIRPAEGETDTGVTICYNTVKDVKYIKPIISASDICINPVNWHTDATPATLHDTITVTVSPAYHVLVVTGYSGSEYSPYKDFLNVGDIHSCEPWLYSECLAKNISVRTKKWREKGGN